MALGGNLAMEVHDLGGRELIRATDWGLHWEICASQQNILCQEQRRKQTSSSFPSVFQNHRLEDKLPLL